MLAALIWLGTAAGWPSSVLSLGVVASAMVILEAVSLAMVPRINAARDAGETGQAAFSRLHRISVLLTLAILVLGIGVLGFIAALAAQGV